IGNTGIGVTNGLTAHNPTGLFSAGTHPLTIHYNGDTNYLLSPVANQTVYSLVVNAAAPANVLTSGSTSNLTLGSSVTFTATLTSPGSAAAAPGTVTFYDSGAVAIPGCIGVAA